MSEPVDLLLTDVIMPGMNGRTLSERITAHRMASATTPSRTTACSTRGVHFIEKPVPTPALLRACGRRWND